MNELNLFCFITNLCVIALCGALMAILPTLTRKTLLFGVRIPESAQNHIEVKNMKKNYITLIVFGAGITFLIAIIQYIALPDLSLLACMYFPFLLVILQMIAFIFNWRKALKLKEANNWHITPIAFVETRSSQSRGNLSSVPWLYYILSFIIIFASIAVALIHYPSIPDPMPIHFDINMNPDGWAAKSLGFVLMVPLVNLGMLIIMVLAAVSIVKAKLQINMQNPALSFAQHRAYRRLMGHGMGILTLGMVIGIMLSGFISLFPEFKISLGITMAIILLPSILLVAIAIRAGQSGCKLNTKITEADTMASGYRPTDTESKPQGIERDRCDDKHWKLGMFYYNPTDPAILVEDRFGTNIGFNYARTSTKIIVAVLALILIVTYVGTTVVIFPMI